MIFSIKTKDKKLGTNKDKVRYKSRWGYFDNEGVTLIENVGLL